MIKHNQYFEGGVQSLGFDAAKESKSVGVMATGEYTFGTDAAEKMTVVKGELTVRLAGSEEWKTYRDGEAFDVPAHSSFDLKVTIATAYLCEYLA